MNQSALATKTWLYTLNFHVLRRKSKLGKQHSPFWGYYTGTPGPALCMFLGHLCRVAVQNFLMESDRGCKITLRLASSVTLD